MVNGGAWWVLRLTNGIAKKMTTTIVFSVFVFHNGALILTCLLPFKRCITFEQAWNIFETKGLRRTLGILLKAIG